ncbi:MAG: magnesium transporter MgtE [Leptospiraceae bacterium]|nr:MAG: magnesium transporter MgtE [Leptospiraceae bacterium]
MSVNEVKENGKPEEESIIKKLLEIKSREDYLTFLESKEWKEHLLRLLQEEKEQEIKEILDELYDSDIAFFIEQIDKEDAIKLLQYLEPERQGAVLLELDTHVRNELIKELSPEKIKIIVDELESDLQADILNALTEDKKSRVLSLLNPEDRFDVTELLNYPEGTAGSIMSKEIVAVPEDATVNQAINVLRKVSKETDDIYNVFVIDEFGRYKGHITLRKLILSKPTTKVKRIMETELLPIPVDMDVEEVANFFTRYDLITAPVVDEKGILVGRITADDIMEVIQEESTEDILRLGGVSEEETIETPLWKAAWTRTYWLIINLATAFLAASVVKLFEDNIQKVVTLASFLPIVAGMGGNAATQTMSFIIRNIALGEIKEKGEKRFLIRSLLLGLLTGISLSFISMLIIYLLTSNIWLTIIMGIAMFGNLVIAAITGAIVPILLDKLNIDPAIASSIFVTTFTDMGGFFLVLSFASLFMNYLIGV